MWKLVAETVIIYIVINIAMRCMGKRQIGELSTSEIVVALLISEVAASPILDEKIHLLQGIVAVIVLVIMEIIYSYLSIKFPFFMQLTQGRPTVIIEHGKINEKELLKNRLSIAELNEELRMKNINLCDVYMAIIENNGQLSIIPENYAAGVTRKDMGIKVKESPLDFALVIDGMLMDGNLKRAGKDKEFVRSYLKAQGVNSIKEVLVLYGDKNGITFFQKKAKKKSRRK